MRALIVPALAMLLALPAAARADPPWAIADLGHLHEEAHCMEAARRALGAARGLFGGAPLRQTGWAVFADRLGGTAHDAVITCTFGDNRGTRATLALHSRRDHPRGVTMARVILDRFEAADRAITRAWLEEIGVR
jgi:hypothetical protein